ncbi:MAG: DNA alkylation repair protein, partial [Patescibacteria group bacterium]|nr:DNA alkylation repair protein [Patescibacteria group bacterium]
NFYLRHRFALNNWDLVDVTVYKVWGDYLLRHPEKRKDLYRFGRSRNLWERRLAVVATMALIKAGQFQEILDLSVMLLDDKEDLMHKAVGWMLRELGKKDKATLVNFLKEYSARLPRTALRYAIERFPEAERRKYLNIKKI